MSEFGTTHLIDDVILTGAQFNAGLRRQSRELQWLIQRWMFGDTAPSAGGGGVVGGLVVDNVTGQMQLTVSAGEAFYYNAALASPLSPLGLILHPNSEIVNVAAADATNPRIDVVSIKSPTGTDTSEMCLVYEAASDTYATQRGAQPVVTVTAGTPAGSPSAPATPAGELKLAEVLVPAAVANLDTATVTDFRVLSRGLVPRDGTGTVPLRAAREWTQRCGWANAFVSALPGSWAATVPTTGAEALLGYGLTLTNSGAASCDIGVVFPLNVDQRGQAVIGGKIHYSVGTSFDGTTTIVASVISVNAGVLTIVATEALSETSGGGSDLTIDTSPDIIEAGEEVYVVVRITQSGASTGAISFSSAGVTFREPLPTL